MYNNLRTLQLAFRAHAQLVQILMELTEKENKARPRFPRFRVNYIGARAPRNSCPSAAVREYTYIYTRAVGGKGLESISRFTLVYICLARISAFADCFENARRRRVDSTFLQLQASCLPRIYLKCGFCKPMHNARRAFGTLFIRKKINCRLLT